MGKIFNHYDMIANFDSKSDVAVKTFRDLVSRGSRVGLKLDPKLSSAKSGTLMWYGPKTSFMRYYTIDLMKGWIDLKEWAGLMLRFIKA